MTIVEIRRTPYPQNIFKCVTGISLPEDMNSVDIDKLERTLVDLMSCRKPRELDILHWYFRDKVTYTVISERLGITTQRSKQLCMRIVSYLSQPVNILKLKQATSLNKGLSGEKLWELAVSTADYRIDPENVALIMRYLKSCGVFFPSGKVGITLAELISPALVTRVRTLNGIHVAELVAIMNLDFEKTIKGLLYRHNIVSLSDLLVISGRTMAELRGLGELRIASIVNGLAKVGIKADYLADKTNTCSPYAPILRTSCLAVNN